MAILGDDEWQLRLAHERACRDAYVACGNNKPSREDPPGGLLRVSVRKFVGNIFWPFIQERGHTDASFESCKCRGRS